MSATAWLELITSGLITGGIYALVALGLNLQYGLMRILNIAHAEFLMLGAYLTWMAQSSLGVSPLWMVPVSFVLLMLLGVAIHWLFFRRLAATSPNLGIFEARGLMVAFDHAYVQPENDHEASRIVETTVGDRTFLVSPWHLKQLEDFLQLIRVNGDSFLVNVHGDGLLAHSLRTLSASEET